MSTTQGRTWWDGLTTQQKNDFMRKKERSRAALREKQPPKETEYWHNSSGSFRKVWDKNGHGYVIDKNEDPEFRWEEELEEKVETPSPEDEYDIRPTDRNKYGKIDRHKLVVERSLLRLEFFETAEGVKDKADIPESIVNVSEDLQLMERRLMAIEHLLR